MKEAQRENKRRGLSILQVGDPLLDLVGMLVGGVIATFDQFGSDGDLEAKLAALKEIDDRIDDRVYGVLTVDASVASRTSFGGTAPERVRAAIAAHRKEG